MVHVLFIKKILKQKPFGPLGGLMQEGDKIWGGIIDQIATNVVECGNYMK